MSINNIGIFNASLAGVMAGMVRNSSNPLTDTYVSISAEAVALATEVDLLIAPIALGPTGVQCDIVEELSQTMYAFFFRQSGSVVPADYATVAGAIVTAYNQANSVALIGTNNNTYYWQGKGTWTLTGNLADDANQTTTIGSHKEYRRRIGDGPMRQATTITISANLDASDSFDTCYDSGGFDITYTGTVSVSVASQTITTYTPRAVATNTPNQLLNSSALVWTPYVGNGFVVRMANGPANGLMATVALDIGGNAARVGSFLNASQTETQPANGNGFDIVAYPQVVNALRLNVADVGFTYQNLYFKGQSNAAAYMSVVATFTGATFLNCCFDGIRYPIPQGAQFINCAVMNGNGATSTTIWRCASSVLFAGGVMFDLTGGSFNQLTQGHILMRRGALLQGVGLYAVGGQGATSDAYITLQDCGVFDIPGGYGSAIAAREGGKCLVQTYWGNTGANNIPAAGVDRSGKIFLLGTAQTATNGGGLEVTMPNTANTTWAAIRAAGGVKDTGASDASAMVVL